MPAQQAFCQYLLHVLPHPVRIVQRYTLNWTGSKIDEPRLYNLEDDISESENRIQEFPKIYDDLKLTLENIRDLGSERLNMKK